MRIFEYSSVLLEGLVTTLELTFWGTALTLVLAFALALARVSRLRWLRWASAGYVEVARGSSLYVQAFWLFFALPSLGIRLDAFWVGVFALGYNLGAFGSEVVRAAILAVPRDQVEAAITLNLSPWQRTIHVILPQAIVIALPGLSNIVVEVVKSTTFISLITVSELTFRAQLYRQETGNTLETFGFLMISYFLICSVVVWNFRALERRLAIGLDRTTRNL